jgi:hypothetical protein
MKKLKKGLSLLLVLAMVFSLATTAFAGWDVSGYGDADQITQDEAVAVMTGLGVIEGDDTTGLFQPTGTYTREAAAKVLTYMLLGPTAASKLTATTDPFDDVPADRWSAGCIAYLANEGIIEGYGDGNFGPQKELTQAAWLKMLLCAMGYDADKNGMGDDANWATKAQALAAKSGLISGKDLGLDWNRETAVYYAFKAVQKNKNLADSTDKTAPFIVTVDTYEDTEVTDKQATSTDDFGRPTQEYKAYGADEAYATYVADATLTYEDQSVTYAEIIKALGDSKAKFVIYEDGYTSKSVASTPANPTTTSVGGKGSTVEVYTINASENEYRVVVINTYAAVLGEGAVNEATESTEAYIQVEGSSEKGQFKTADYAKGDVVLYTKKLSAVDATEKIVSVEKAESAQGKPTGYGSDKAVDFVRIDGEKVYLSKEIAKVTGATYNTSELIAGSESTLAKATFYYDTFGNIIYVGKAVTDEIKLDGYVYVLAISATGANDLKGTEASVKYRVVDLETGAISIVNAALAANKNGELEYALKDGTAGGTAPTDDDSKTAGFYGYYKMEDGSIVLEDVASSGNANTVGAIAVSATGNTYNIAATDSSVINNSQDYGYADENTVLTYIEVATPNVVTTVTGIANFPSVLKADGTTAGNTKILMVRDTETTKMTHVYVYNVGENTPKAGEEAAKTFGYFLSAGEYDKATNTKTYTFVVNGAETTYVGASTLSFATESVYEIKLNSKGEIISTGSDKLSAQADCSNKKVTVIAGSYVVLETAGKVSLADGYQVYDQSTAKKGYVVDATVSVYTDGTNNVFIVVENPVG